MKKILLFTLIIILIPIIIIGFDKEKNIIKKIKYGSINNKTIRVKKTKTGEIVNIPLEKYIIGVVAGEMPAYFNFDALKAQAVASRTYVLKRCEKNNKDFDVYDNTNSQVYLTEEEIKNKWKDKYKENINKVEKAVNSTKGEVILYNNNLIDAMFFSTSNGYTENSGDVFSKQEPYLVSVKSSWDETISPAFKSELVVSKKEFLFNLGLSENYIVINNIEKTASNRIKNITINNKVFEGKKLRQIFKLKSTSFNISLENDNVVFNVLGYGHGVGMSQYGANGMANEGYKYKDILKYYFQNCEIKKIN